MSEWSPDNTVEIVKAFVSWPFVALLVVPIVLAFFRKEIGRLIDRIRELPGSKFSDPPQVQQVAPAAATLVVKAMPGNAVAGGPSATVTLAGSPSSQANQASSGAIQQPDPLQEIAANPEKSLSALKQLQTRFLFERTFNMIWGSQWRALQFMVQAGRSEYAESELSAFYEEHVNAVRSHSKVPPADMEMFRRFLISSQLIEVRVDPTSGPTMYSLTETGRAFVSYIWHEFQAGGPPMRAW